MKLRKTSWKKSFIKQARIVLIGMLVVTLLLPCLIFPVSALDYADVPSTYWAYPYIDEVTDRGIMEAYTGNYFRPSYAMTRLSAVTALGKLAGVYPNDNCSSDFTDMPSGTTGLAYVMWAKENNIVNGTTATTFSPNLNITKESFAVMIYNFLVAFNHSYTRSTTAAFSDQAEISPWALDAVKELHAIGLVSGDEHNNFEPDHALMRSEAAVVFSQIPSCTNLTNGIYSIKNSSTSRYMTVKNTALGYTGLNMTDNNYIVTEAVDNSRGAQYFRITQDLETGYFNIAPLCSFFGFYRQLKSTGYGAGSSVLTAVPQDSNYMRFIPVQVGPRYQFVLAANPNVALADEGGSVKLKAKNTSDTTQLWNVYIKTAIRNAETEYRSLKWAHPLENPSNYYLTSSFGFRYLPEVNGSEEPCQMHAGVDLSAPTGTKLVAVADGEIAYRRHAALGLYAVLIPSDSPGVLAVYQHMSVQEIEDPEGVIRPPGDMSVNKGQCIGLSGSSGVGTGAHLHFGVVYDIADVAKRGDFDTFFYPNAFYGRYVNGFWS